MKKLISIFMAVSIGFVAAYRALSESGNRALGSGNNTVVDQQLSHKSSSQQHSLSAANAVSSSSEDVGLPIIGDDRPSQVMCKRGYTVSYNTATRLPNWVAWHLTRGHSNGSYKRKGMSFHEDPQVEGVQVQTSDYARSGYDRGHMCPSGDNKWSRGAQEDSFLMTNICPQLHALNAGDWNDLEMKCRDWARHYGDVYIVCGPLLSKQRHKTIGYSHVVVPEAFYKVVLCTKGHPKAIGFIYPQDSEHRKMSACVVSVDEVEQRTGIDFFAGLDDAVEHRIEASPHFSEW